MVLNLRFTVYGGMPLCNSWLRYWFKRQRGILQFATGNRCYHLKCSVCSNQKSKFPEIVTVVAAAHY